MSYVKRFTKVQDLGKCPLFVLPRQVLEQQVIITNEDDYFSHLLVRFHRLLKQLSCKPA